MRILVSALSCNPAFGSDALVGFKYVEALARRHEVVVLASPPTQVPAGVTLVPCNAGPCSFNEVGPSALVRFELDQWRLARGFRHRFPFELVHRVTPSAIQLSTWSAYLSKPLAVGPIIAADSPPTAFAPYLSRPVSAPSRPRWHPTRIANRICRTLVQGAAMRQSYLHKARLILVGTRTALRKVPEDLHERCRSITYSGVEHNIYVPPKDRSDRGSLNLLFVGRLVPYKGLELLLQAVKIAAHECQVHLRIVGEGDPVYKKYLLQLTHELCLEKVVAFLPPRRRGELIDCYQQADIFCFPTLCDTYGIALLEAMSCGCAALVSDIAGAGELVDGTNGLKVPLDEPDHYIKKYADDLIALAKNPGLRGRLGEAARRYVLQHHDWSHIGQRLLNIYEEFALT